MRYISYLLTGLVLILSGISGTPVHASSTLVASQSEYQQAVKSLKPGDSIVLANGEWQNFEILGMFVPHFQQ